MDAIRMELPSVSARLNYLNDVPADKPAVYINMPIPEVHRRGPQLGPREVAIHDARPCRDQLSLDEEGVILVDAPTSFVDFYDADQVRAAYYPEMEELVKRETGAVRVIAFDHNLRSRALAKEGKFGAQLPVLFAHNDYTEESGPQRVRDLVPDEAGERLEKRFSIINVWRPTRRPVYESPLAVCDAQMMGKDDLVAIDLIYPERVGEIQALRYDPNHRWLYFPEMEASEVLLLKCFDSAGDGRARFTAHCAFDDPTTKPHAESRESVEVRTLAFFDEPR